VVHKTNGGTWLWILFIAYHTTTALQPTLGNQCGCSLRHYQST